MRLNQQPILRSEDYPSEQSWIGKLFTTLNPFIQAVNQVLNDNIDFTDNIPSVVQTYSVSGFQSFSFLWPYPNFTPVDVRVLKATSGSAQLPTILIPAWSYDSTAKTVTVSNMVEITASAVVRTMTGQYNFTMRASI